MARKTKILVICEGVKKEPSLLQWVKRAGFLPEDVSIVPYKTNIYQLYLHIESHMDGRDWNGLDIQNILLSESKSQEERRILSDHYTDKLLVFDFDPQDGIFKRNPAEARRSFLQLISFFDDSTTNGKLYLSYPMIEALQHVTRRELRDGLNDSALFMQRKFCLGQIGKGKYKQHVIKEGEKNLQALSHDDIVRLIKAHIYKAEKIAGMQDAPQYELNPVDAGFHLNLFENEFNSYEMKKYGCVVSTSLFYVAEAYPQKLVQESSGPLEDLAVLC